MKISPSWVREFVDLKVDDRKLAEDLTLTGTAVESIGQDGVFEMEITTNRPDCMNHYGVARECSAVYDVPLTRLEPKLQKDQGKANFSIEIADAEGCARYTARIVRGVKIGPSPERIAGRLASVEQRGINNVADASNYTLWEMGHPTHAFDLDLLRGGKIVVRRARAGETLKTLDGVERKLSPDDLIIADANRPVALAGVMGGFDTMITERTRNVLIESAWFDPVAIRKSSRRHGLHTDASHRFERGADFAAASLACARVAQLIADSAGGQLEGEEIDVIARQIRHEPVPLSRTEVLRILGEDIEQAEIERILRRLGFGVTPGRAAVAVPRRGGPLGSGGARAAVAEEAATYTIEIPTWRLDVEREIDVIEEIARVHGYNQFANTLPEFAGAVVEHPDAAKNQRLESRALALGYNQAITLTFISEQDARQFSPAAAVELENPISDEARFLRSSMLPGMLEMLAWNLNRGNDDARLFEMGDIFEMAGAKVDERKQFSLGATGNAEPASLHRPARPYSFFDMKGDVETLLTAFHHQSLYYDAHAADYYHPGRSARAVMDGATVARFGQLHPEIAAARKLRQDVYLAEIYLDRLYQHELRQAHYEPLPRYPAVERDFSFIFEDRVTYDLIRGTVEALRIAELRKFVPVEIFRGGAIVAGRYSLLLRATFQSDERTLRDDEVALWSSQIIQALQAQGGTLRA
ncbi:MAG TPA: phenylalanine--tRNA ligase subunit beta [Terriglobales bacterium]|jgi:phenylalanyl-tRNA synthetase beta chain|nr:phenylalanine--tRNA ligase subunit beta [Terriglobales bacterium]